MRLLTLANRYYLVALVSVLAVASWIAFLIISRIVDEEFNRKLFAEKDQLIYELHEFDQLQDDYFLNIGDRIDLKVLNGNEKIEPRILDTIMYDTYEKKVLPYRVLIFSNWVDSTNYEITIAKSLLPNQEIVNVIGEILAGIVVALIVVLFVLNNVLSTIIWKPFYKLIDTLSAFQLSRPHPVKFVRSKVKEFDELTDVLETMIEKSVLDYKHLKEFTENTSHEIQTPLAIIKNKAEVLLQEPLPQEILEGLGIIYESTTRLSRLKEGLSLLTKIDNDQFIDAEPIDIKQYIIDKLVHFEELIQMKKLKVTTTFYGAPVLKLNPHLVYILITNLLSNAIKHSDENGQINIILKDVELKIENTGEELQISTDQLFNRFVRSGKRTDSTGLGLSLVKRITDYYKMKIWYLFKDGWHQIIIDF